jgi:hypothetical protein
MSSPFLIGGGGISLAQLQDGSTPINVASVAVQSLVPNLPVCTSGSRRLVSRLIGLADLNFSPTTSPFPGTFYAGDFVTAYSTAPRSVNDLVTEVDALTGSNVGVGDGDVFRDRTGPQLAPVLEFRTIAGSSDGIAVATGANEVNVSCNLIGGNPSLTPGATMYIGKAGASLDFRTLVAGSGVTITQGVPTGEDVTIAASGFVTNLANEGGGAAVFDSLAGTVAELRTLVGSANGLAVTQNAMTIGIDNTLTGGNLGAGAQVFANKTGAALNLRSIVAGPSIGVIQNANDVTISYVPPISPPGGLAIPGISELWTATTGTVVSETCAVSLQPAFDRWILSGAGAGIRYSNDGFATANVGLVAGGVLYVTGWSASLGIATARSYNAVTPACLTSPDGITWTPQAAPPSRAQGQQRAIVWTGTLFVCTLHGGTNTIETSPDGITWTSRPTPQNIWAVISLGGSRVAGVSNINGPSYSTDGGVTWTAGSGLAAPTTMNDLAFSPTLSLILATDLTLGNLIRSDDLGVTWFAVPGSNPTGVTWTCAMWVPSLSRFYFTGGLGDGAVQIMTTTGGFPLLEQTSSNYIMGEGMTQIPNTLAYDSVRTRVYSGAIGAQSLYSNGTGNLIALTTGPTPASVQAFATYNVGSASAPPDLATRSTTYYRTADTNMATRILSVERPLAGPSVKVSRRFDGALAGQTFWESDSGGISFGWDAVNKQLRFTTTAANFYGSTTVVGGGTKITATATVTGMFTSASLVAATTYYAANVAVARLATWDMAAGGPFTTTITLSSNTLTTATIPMYAITIAANATGTMGNFVIERLYTY